MGLVGFSKKVLRRHLDPFQRRKIRVLSSLGVGLVLALLCFAQDFGDYSHRLRRLQSDDVETTTEAPDFYWDDLLLDKPYNKEPTGKKFLIVFHCIGIAYLVLGLNTVCDVYFAGSIDLLCDAWNLTPDVAGATWMAAGGSAPEFFTSIVGATIAQNDVGFGTIVGSAVFNVLFVIGLCGYVAKGNIELTWWPLFRDCTYYICSLAVLAAFTFNQLIEAWEAAILFSLYIGYVSFMFVNKPLNVWLKTRLQSAEGFAKAGGFRGIYSGIASAASGSAPSAATFFCSYELTKNLLKPRTSSTMFPFVHMFAATIGEVVSLAVRNPFEVVKQRAQAYTHMNSLQALRYTLVQEGVFGLYRGYWNTLFREIPFALLQYPLWELFKSIWSWEQGHPVWAWQSSICGAVSGGFAAAVTTPLDVAKTRVMLAPKGSLYTQSSVIQVIRIIKSQEGIAGLFSGVTMRTVWISLGGAVFFGFYEKAKNVLQDKLER